MAIDLQEEELTFQLLLRLHLPLQDLRFPVTLLPSNRLYPAEGATPWAPLSFHRWDVTVLMKRSRTSITAEQLSSIPARLTHIGVPQIRVN